MLLTGFYGDDVRLDAAPHKLGRRDDAVRRKHRKEFFKLFVGVFLITFFAAAEG